MLPRRLFAALSPRRAGCFVRRVWRALLIAALAEKEHELAEGQRFHTATERCVDLLARQTADAKEPAT